MTAFIVRFGIKPLDWDEMKAVDTWSLMDLLDREARERG